MLSKIPKISEQIYKEKTLSILINKYAHIGPQWTKHQMEWMSDIFPSFQDHDKFLIIIYLTKKTLDFYSRNFTKLNYEQFYLKDTVEIEKFNVIEVANAINIPKESARRKILELEKSGVIRIFKKKFIIDRSAYPFIKPVKSIRRMSRFLALFAKIAVKEKILQEKLTSENLEIIIKDNFSYVWKLFYELQIPMMVNYKKVFGDIESFHIFGTCVANQHYLYSKKLNMVNENRKKFIYGSFTDKEIQGINAMSISDITGIPRATVVRKLKRLIKINCLTIDDKKHYKLTGSFVKNLMPIQNAVLNQLADFSTRIFNIAIL